MDIPRYPASRALKLDDKPFLDGVFGELQPRISELTFADLYLFRHAHDYRLTLVTDTPVILGKGYDGGDYFLPPLANKAGKALLALLGEGLTFYGGDECFAESDLQGKRLVVTEDRDNFDYLYVRRELAELPGNRFHKKKNRVNYFASRHVYSVELFSERHLEGSLRLLDDWRRVHAEIGNVSLAAEAEADREALVMALELGLAGVVVLVAGEVKGFALGEKLNDTTSVCRFEKADPFLEGLNQLIDREFNRLLFTDCTFVNREQDLGVPNLRKAKLSYHPVDLVKKYRARMG